MTPSMRDIIPKSTIISGFYLLAVSELFVESFFGDVIQSHREMSDIANNLSDR